MNDTSSDSCLNDIPVSMRHGFAFQPYWIIFLSPVIFTTLSMLANLCDAEKRKNLKTREGIAASVFKCNDYVLGTNLLLNFIQFVYFIHGSLSSGTSSGTSSKSSWVGYQIFYIRWMSSGALTTLAALMMSGSFHRRKLGEMQQIWKTRAMRLLILSFCPPLITHVAPMCGIYIWVFAIVISSLVFPIAYLYLQIDKSIDAEINDIETPIIAIALKEPKKMNCIFLYALFIKLFIIGIFILMMQSFYHYGVFFYNVERDDDGNLVEGRYVGILVNEFMMRSTSCYFETLANNSQQFIFFLGLF